jgi:3-hydroxyacyl-CoA dehydrogenase
LTDIAKVGVIGAGLMGSGIAEVCARAELDVLVREINDASLEAGQARITKSLDRGAAKGKLSPADRDTALGLLSYTTGLGDLGDLGDQDLWPRPPHGPGRSSACTSSTRPPCRSWSRWCRRC